MEEIKVNEYVRTKRHGICKLLKCEIDGAGEWCGLVDVPIFLRKDNILKHSPNIIDLIEEGDYVNGVIVTAQTCNDYIEVDYGENQDGYHNKDIKTILTKQQYQANCYEVK